MDVLKDFYVRKIGNFFLIITIAHYVYHFEKKLSLWNENFPPNIISYIFCVYVYVRVVM